MRRVLLVSDSSHIDSGFGRVAREIGTGLVRSGQFRVAQLGWFHLPSSKIIPFPVIPTTQSGKSSPTNDSYGAQSYQKVVDRMQPDVVLAIGDPWMIRHIAMRTRSHKLVGYVPIDSKPIPREWARVFRAMDQLVVFGNFGEVAVREIDPGIPVAKIPHGVDAQTFRPLGSEARRGIRTRLYGDPDLFVVGCVARNNKRKMLPRLLKAFRKFINGSSCCQDCGDIRFAMNVSCGFCGGRRLKHAKPKDKARLYLHTVPDDPAGCHLYPLIERYKLQKSVMIPDGMQVARGVPDPMLNELYNSFDAFILPSAGEGWGLPLLEAMAAGVPALAPHYSGQVDFMEGAGEFISIADWWTSEMNTEWALFDQEDCVFKLDRLYYPKEKFLLKWQARMMAGGMEEGEIQEITAGEEARSLMGRAGVERAKCLDWSVAVQAWVELLVHLAGEGQEQHQTVEVIQ